MYPEITASFHELLDAEMPGNSAQKLQLSCEQSNHITTLRQTVAKCKKFSKNI